MEPAAWAAARAGLSAPQICRNRSVAAVGSRARLLVIKNKNGDGLAKPQARVSASQRSSNGQPQRVWEPVGSSSKTMILGLSSISPACQSWHHS